MVELTLPTIRENIIRSLTNFIMIDFKEPIRIIYRIISNNFNKVVMNIPGQRNRLSDD